MRTNAESPAPNPIDPPSEALFEGFRRQMPVAERWSYLDHAAVAPISGPAHAAMVAWAEDLVTNGDVDWNRWSARYEAIRGQAARLLGASPEEIALVRNTTEGVTLVSEGFLWEPGDNVVVPAGEFPSNLYPWMALERRGVEVRRVAPVQGRLDLERVEAACDGRTRIVAASWVDYATGWRTDLDALCEIAHRHGALCFVDAIQGLGVFPLDVGRTPVDFLAADGHKWLLGPEGAGIAYIRCTHLARLRPFGLGWHSVKHCGQFDNPALDLRDSAARFEGGTAPMASFMGLSESLRLLMEIGVESIGARVLALADRTRELLANAGARIASPAEPAGRSGIVSFELPGVEPNLVRRACRDRGVALSCRAGRLRVSPHAYNSEADLQRLIDALTRQLPGNRS